MTVDPVLLAVVVAFLLPLRLISFALCLASEGRSTSARHLRRSCAALAVAAALLAVIYALPRDHASECAAPVDAFSCGKDGEGGFREELHLEVEQLKLQLARLESHLDNNSRPLDEKSDALYKENDLVMKAMGLDIQSLINEQENIKVQVLRDVSRKLNSDIWSVAKDTAEKVEALHADMKKVQAITDEWIKMNSSINKIWSFSKDTEKRVEGLYSDFKKGFKQMKRNIRFWGD